MTNITKRAVDAAHPTDRRKYIWDRSLKGFGLLVLPSGIKSFVVQYRNEAGRTRRMTLGRCGTLTPDSARKMALDVLARASKGQDPVAERQIVRSAPDVNTLLTRYLTEHVEVHNAPTTQTTFRIIVDKHIRPRIGSLKVTSVMRQDVVKLHRAMVNTPRQANLTLSVISKAFNLAEVWGLRPEYSNPIRLIKRYKENERDRFLSGDELGRLGRTLEEAATLGLPWEIKAKGSKHLPKDAENRRSAISPMALAGIHLLLFTGARLSEIIELEWSHIDFDAGTIALPARKGDGRRPHPVSNDAMTVLADIERIEGSSYALPRLSDPTKHLSKAVMETTWQRVRRHAKIEDVRLHDLRHTFGTLASQAGGNAFSISHILRHKNVTITNRYVNPDANPIRAASNTVSERISAGLRGEGSRTPHYSETR